MAITRTVYQQRAIVDGPVVNQWYYAKLSLLYQHWPEGITQDLGMPTLAQYISMHWPMV